MRVQVPIELVEAARSGGPADVERLLAAVWPDAYRLARAILGEQRNAEDVAQEASVAMFRGLASLRDAGAFAGWFYRIVVREALRAKKRSADATTLPSEAAYTEDFAASLDLWRALATLPDKLRAVVVLHYFENLTSREIAGIIHVPAATVRFRLMTARRRLCPLLQDLQPQAKGENTYAL